MSRRSSQGAENTKLGAWVDSTPAIILNVQRQPGANVIQVVDGIKKLLPRLAASLPAALDVRVVTDRTTTIRASVRDVQFELALSVVLVVLVIYLFLANVCATLIPSLSVPLSLDRHARRDVSLRLLARQPLADGADHRDRLRRRRRHRHDREHRALRGGRRPAARSRAERLEADRLHDHLADGVADRRADSAAVHGRRGRAPVPRIRDHARGDDRDFGGGVAHARADAVRQAAAPHAAEGKHSASRRARTSSSTT